MKKEVIKTKTESKSGIIENSKVISFNFNSKICHMDFYFQDGTYSGSCSFSEILEGVTKTQKNIINGMFKKAKKLCINNVIKLDVPIIDEDITEDMENDEVVEKLPVEEIPE